MPAAQADHGNGCLVNGDFIINVASYRDTGTLEKTLIDSILFSSLSQEEKDYAVYLVEWVYNHPYKTPLELANRYIELCLPHEGIA